MGHTYLKKDRGFTLMEVMISMLITAVITTAAFQFYVRMHQQSETQYDISELQQLSRASMQDISATLRMGGFKLSAPPAFEIKGDTLAVYFSMTQPVDTVQYFLTEFNDAEYLSMANRPQSMHVSKLMKKTNSNPPQVFADYITNFSSVFVDSSNVVVTIVSVASRADEYYSSNSGFRTDSLSQRINVRNAI